MAERNIEKAIAEGEKLAEANGCRYSLKCNEIAAIIKKSRTTLDLAYNAYCVGLVSGYRKGKREARKGATI